MSDKYEILIKVYTNDADYATNVSVISKEKLDLIRPLIEAIKNFEPYTATVEDCSITWTHEHNYPTGECCREDLGMKTPREHYTQFSEDVFQTFEDLAGWYEYGFHTVELITVCPVREKEILLGKESWWILNEYS